MNFSFSFQKTFNFIFSKKILAIITLGFVFLSLVFSTLNTVPANAQTISDLNILGIRCLFPGQPNCTGANLFDNAVSFMLAAAPFLAGLVMMYGGYQYFFGALTDTQANGKKTILAGAIGLVIVYLAQTARTIITQSVDPSTGQFRTNAITGGINNIVDFLFAIATVLTVLVIVWGGYKYMISALPSDQKDGLQTIRQGITGLILVFLARPIQGLLTGTFSGNATSSTFTFNTASVLLAARNIIGGFLIPLSVVASVFFIVIGGYYFIVGNDPKKGRESIQNAIIGLVTVLLSTTIVTLISYFIPNT